MKELLKKFYEIDIEDYYEVEDGYLFYLYGQLFYFYKLDNECNLDVVKEIYNYVCLKSNIRLHCIVYNIFNEYR